MDETQVRRKSDDKGWGWIGTALAILVFMGIVAAAGGTAYQIGKQQAAADDKKRTESEKVALARRQLAESQIADLIQERDALRDRVLKLETELLAERSANPNQQSSLRCINGELVVRRGDTWTSAGNC
jgi:flagellar basal body-associated protein FliL